MVNYKDLGLVNTREMFKKAIEGKYAIAAFNFNNMEQMQAIIQATVETKSPVILQVSSGARKYANQTLLRYMAQGAVEYAKELLRSGKCPPEELPQRCGFLSRSAFYAAFKKVTGVSPQRYMKYGQREKLSEPTEYV